MMRPPHEVLGVDPDATEEEVRQAFRNLAQIYHPDRFDGASPAVLDAAVQHMQEVNAAYQELVGLKGKMVYWDTPGYSNEERASLTKQLLDRGIPHRWNGEELSVDLRYDDAVEKLMT